MQSNSFVYTEHINACGEAGRNVFMTLDLRTLYLFKVSLQKNTGKKHSEKSRPPRGLNTLTMVYECNDKTSFKYSKIHTMTQIATKALERDNEDKLSIQEWLWLYMVSYDLLKHSKPLKAIIKEIKTKSTKSVILLPQFIPWGRG